MTVLCFNSEVTESRRIKSKGHWSHFGGTWMAQHLKMTLNVGFPLFVTHIILCEKLKAPIMRSLYKRSRWPHADVPQWPLVSPPPFISVCTIYCVYEAALIWYFITEESDKNTPADSENVQNPLYNLIHPFNIHHFYKFLLLKNTALYPHFF